MAISMFEVIIRREAQSILQTLQNPESCHGMAASCRVNAPICSSSLGTCRDDTLSQVEWHAWLHACSHDRFLGHVIFM